MTFSELLKRQLPDDKNQKTVAMEWLLKSGTNNSPSYVETRLSRCLKGDVEAVKFFFADRQRAACLLDVLNVAADARPAILEAADQLIETNGKAPPRLVIDVTPWSRVKNPKQLFDAVGRHLLESQPPRPVVMLVTDVLYDGLPRSFDKLDWLQVEAVDEKGAAQRAQELAKDGALIASPSRFPTERWLAIDYDEQRERLSIEPPDGFAVFSTRGSLPSPNPRHELSAFVDATELPAVEPSGRTPVETRRLILQLGDEALAGEVEVDALRRLALARSLGVVAAATERDRIEAELRRASARLGHASPRLVSRAELDAALERASRRHVPPEVLRVGDELHAINLDPSLPDEPRVTMHRFQPPPTALSRIREAMAEWTECDFEADPYLIDLVARLDPQQRELAAMLHARAWVLAANAFKAKEASLIQDWRSELRSLLAQQVPRAELITPRTGRNDQGVFASAPRLAGTDDDLRPLLLLPTPWRTAVENRMRDTVSLQDHWGHEPPVSLLLTPRDDEQWLDTFEQFKAGKFTMGFRANRQVYETWRAVSWQQYDSHLERLWLALSTAIDHAPAVTCADGATLARLGGGIAARITLKRCSENRSGVRGLIDVTHEQGGFEDLSTARYVSYEVPRRTVILGGTVHAEIRFVSSALLLGSPARTVTELAADPD